MRLMTAIRRLFGIKREYTRKAKPQKARRKLSPYARRKLSVITTARVRERWDRMKAAGITSGRLVSDAEILKAMCTPKADAFPVQEQNGNAVLVENSNGQ